MITAVVGRTFLNAYNQKYKKDYSAKEFFDKIFYPLFFDSQKMMMSITNGPFDQGYKRKKHLSSLGRKEVFENFYKKIESGVTDASIYVGAPASDENKFRSTSGLVSDIDFKISSDDVILSWIGAGLGVGVGAYSFLFNDKEVNLKLFEGWSVYRKFLSNPSTQKLSAHKINSWNGRWLAYSCSNEYRKDYDFSELEYQGFFKVEDSKIDINPINWSELYFSLCQSKSSEKDTVYVYDGFVNTNKTVGFIPILFHPGRKLKDVYQKLFGEDHFINQRDFKNLFGIHIKRACELGNIGLTALRPGSLSKYMNNSKSLSFKKDEDTLSYKAYKTWLVTMLSKNKEEITDYTQEVAQIILDYRISGKGTVRKNLIEKELFASTSKKKFIETLITMIPDLENESLISIKKLREEVHLMTHEEFGYFCTLLKFDYTFLEKQQ